jgi:hypothetical protein
MEMRKMGIAKRNEMNRIGLKSIDESFLDFCIFQDLNQDDLMGVD